MWITFGLFAILHGSIDSPEVIKVEAQEVEHANEPRKDESLGCMVNLVSGGSCKTESETDDQEELEKMKANLGIGKDSDSDG